MNKAIIFDESGNMYQVKITSSKVEAEEFIESEKIKDYWTSGFSSQIDEIIIDSQKEFETNKKSAKEKLKVLGLTDAEIRALFP